MIKGFRFTNQLANAEVDARIHQEFLNKNDGIFYGMNLSKTTNSITISEGLCEIAGRPVAVINSETVTTGTDNLYCVLVLEIDLSKESTKDTFSQVSFKLLTSSTGYSAVTQQDINKYNGTSNIYQLEFARFRTTASGIADFKDTRKFLNFNGIYNQVKSECQTIINQIKTELLSVEDGSAYVVKNNISVLEGNITINESADNKTVLTGSKVIDFPLGFSRNNCVVLSFGLLNDNGNISNESYSFGTYKDTNMHYPCWSMNMGKSVTFTNDNRIRIEVQGIYDINGGPDSYNAKYKIVLMRY